MKFGKDFFFWLKIILALIRALRDALTADQGKISNLGPRMVKSVLDVAAKENEDDDEPIAPTGIL